MTRPTIACRQRLPRIGEYEERRGEWTFSPKSVRGLAHAGLVLAKLLPGHDDDSEAERHVLETAIRASRFVPPPPAESPYSVAFSRRTTWAEAAGARSFNLVTPPGQRLIIGLATESPLETGLTLHHTYGVPIIPGSALKGLAAHYASQVFGELPDQQELGQRVEFTDQEGKRRVRTGTQFRTLFGDTDDAGFITFHDAWIDPASLTGDPPSLTREDEGLLLDVMTPHHGDYYGRKQYRIQGQPLPGGPRDGDFIPPTDFDNPVPVSFLSVRGKFHFVLTCVDASADGQRWLSWTADLVCAALEDWGIGGKTSSGYGRLLSPTPRHQRRAVTKMPLAQPQTVGPTERNRQRNEPVPGSMSPPAPAAPEARARTKRERVTLLAAPKNGKAKVRTEAGEEIVCERIPFHPQAHEGKQCRADVTREAGKATRGVFKSWM